jgi:hypothetical protein
VTEFQQFPSSGDGRSTSWISLVTVGGRTQDAPGNGSVADCEIGAPGTLGRRASCPPTGISAAATSRLTLESDTTRRCCTAPTAG